MQLGFPPAITQPGHLSLETVGETSWFLGCDPQSILSFPLQRA